MKEFCLKDELSNFFDKWHRRPLTGSREIEIENIFKEFIKILKEDSAKGFCSHTELCEKIDKFTGDLE